MKAGLVGRSAAHHAGASVETIIRASNCRATERPSWKLRTCLRAPKAARRAPGRRFGGRRSGGRVRVDYDQDNREIPPPVPRLQQETSSASSIPGNIHFVVRRKSGLGKNLAEERLRAKLPVPEARLFARHRVVTEDFNRNSTQGARLSRAVCRQ